MSVRVLNRSDIGVLSGAALAIAAAAVTRYGHLGEVASFLTAAVAVALLAALVGRSVEQLGDRLGPGATGALQGALGNLPELFIGFFALKAGLVDMVKAAIIGSILGNALLVLGLAFLAGGLKNGVQRFAKTPARMTCTLLVLAVAALVLPSLASYVHTPAEKHEGPLSVGVAIVLLVIFALQLPASIRRNAATATASAATASVSTASAATVSAATASASTGGTGPASNSLTSNSLTSDGLTSDGLASDGLASDGLASGSPASDASAAGTGPADDGHEPPRWPLWLAIGMLALASLSAALISDWFVAALEPAIKAFGISQAFAGLVVVALAGNAIENVVGIKLAYRNKADYALSVVINSPLQIALVLAPALVLLSFVAGTTLTLVFAPMLIVVVIITVVTVTLIVLDGESNWLEGAILVALYAIIATVFWWG